MADPSDRDTDLGRLVFTISAIGLRHVSNTTIYDGARNPKSILQADVVRIASDQYELCLLGRCWRAPSSFQDIGVRKKVAFFFDRESYLSSTKRDWHRWSDQYQFGQT